MMNKVATAQKEREDTEISLLNTGPIARAQVERVAALNARIEELEAMLAGIIPVRHRTWLQNGLAREAIFRINCLEIMMASPQRVCAVF